MFKKGDNVRYINERGRVAEGLVERVVPKWFGGHKYMLIVDEPISGQRVEWIERSSQILEADDVEN